MLRKHLSCWESPRIAQPRLSRDFSHSSAPHLRPWKTADMSVDGDLYIFLYRLKHLHAKWINFIYRVQLFSRIFNK